MKRAKVINCKKLGIRRTVIEPEFDRDIIKLVDAGEYLDVDNSMIYWSWDDKPFYRVSIGANIYGYAIAGCLEFSKKGEIEN